MAGRNAGRRVVNFKEQSLTSNTIQSYDASSSPKRAREHLSQAAANAPLALNSNLSKKENAKRRFSTIRAMTCNADPSTSKGTAAATSGDNAPLRQMQTQMYSRKDGMKNSISY